mmetsp:Transcript_38053/g.58087  ORF Transcript_38053/g.58087 Transcript_38053/m.58087 type:complete len:92 (-) Transcript_38053:14-289(-)
MMAHPNVVRMIDYFENRDFIYICMEYHRGQDLREFTAHVRQVQGTNFDEFSIRDIMYKIGEAVEYVHDLGIIIRNLSLKSILMTENQHEGN